MKDRAGRNAVLVAAIHAFIKLAHLPSLSFGLKLGNAETVASNATQTLRPTDSFKMGNANFFGCKLLNGLNQGRLGFHNGFT
jgi:hypothetical protein